MTLFSRNSMPLVINHGQLSINFNWDTPLPATKKKVTTHVKNIKQVQLIPIYNFKPLLLNPQIRYSYNGQ